MTRSVSSPAPRTSSPHSTHTQRYAAKTYKHIICRAGGDDEFGLVSTNEGGGVDLTLAVAYLGLNGMCPLGPVWSGPGLVGLES